MANQQHLDLLRQGVETWNRWRKEHRDMKPDLSGADFSNIILNDVRLSFADLHGTHFRSSNLSRAYFVSSDLSYADFSHALLRTTVALFWGDAVLRRVREEYCSGCQREMVWA